MTPSRPIISKLGLLFLTVFLAALPACRSSARAREHVEKGNQAFTQKQFSDADKEYREAIRIDPDFAGAYYRLGLLQIEQQHPTAATQSLSKAVDLDPKNLDARLQLGELLVSSTQYSEAQKQAQTVLQQDGENAAAHRLLGQIAMHQMQYVPAENELKQAIDLDPRDAQTYAVLGMTQLLDAEYGAAEKSFQTAVDLKPDDPQTFINLADYYKGQNNPDRAEQVLRQGIARDPRAVALPIALASLDLEHNRLLDAKHLLDQVEADANAYSDGRWAVASFYLDYGDAASALDRFRALAEKNDPNQAAAKKVAECYLQLSRWQDTDQWIDQHDKDRKDPDFRLLRARADLGALRLREARSELEGLIRDSPDVPSIFIWRRWIRRKSSRRWRSRRSPTRCAFSPDIYRPCWGSATLACSKVTPAPLWALPAA